MKTEPSVEHSRVSKITRERKLKSRRGWRILACSASQNDVR